LDGKRKKIGAKSGGLQFPWAGSGPGGAASKEGEPWGPSVIGGHRAVASPGAGEGNTTHHGKQCCRRGEILLPCCEGKYQKRSSRGGIDRKLASIQYTWQIALIIKEWEVPTEKEGKSALRKEKRTRSY